MNNRLLELTDRNFDFLQQLDGNEFLSELRRCMSTLKSDPELRDILSELRQEASELPTAYINSEAPHINQIIELGKEAVGAIPELAASSTLPPPGLETVSEAEGNDWHNSMAGFFWAVERRGTHSRYKRPGDPSLLYPLASILIAELNNLILPLADHNKPTQTHSKQEKITELYNSAHKIRSDSTAKFKALIHDQRSHPGTSLALLEHITDYLTHGYSNSAPHWLSLFMRQEPNWQSIPGNLITTSQSTRDSRTAIQDQEKSIDFLKRQLRRLHHGIRTKLGTIRSLRSTIHRFKERCEWHDRGLLARLEAQIEIELRHSMQKKPARQTLKGRKPSTHGRLARATKDSVVKIHEDRLTQELARWLFDAGHRPILKPSAAGLEPDIYGDFPADSHWPTSYTLYIESKLSTDKRDPLQLIKGGLRQFFGTVHRLRGERPSLSEAFFVVFRTSGRRIEFPDEFIRLGGWILFPVSIDLAPGIHSGSRESDLPLVIGEEIFRAALHG